MNEDPNTLLGGPLELPDSSNTKFQPERHKKTHSKKPLFIVVLVLIVMALVAGGYFVYRYEKNKKIEKANQANSKISQVLTDVPNVPQTKDYKSSAMLIEITYPANWTVTENDGMHVTSPNFVYQAADGSSVKGNFQVYIRQTARPVDDKYIGNAVADQPSKTLMYSSPAPNQRTSTNLTVFGAGTDTHFTYFMITSNFQLNPGDQLGLTYGQEPGTDIIVGGYSSSNQKDDLNFTDVSLDNFDKTNAYNQAINILKSLKLD
jgi:hypothetical protein